MNKAGKGSLLILVTISSICLSACGGSVIINDEQEPDPVVIDVPIAFVERDLSLSEGEPLRDLSQPSQFIPGASLLIKARANASAQESDLTPRLLQLMLGEDAQIPEFNDESSIEERLAFAIDIKDLESDYSGERIIFAARAPELEGMDEPPSWNIYEYDRSNDELRRIIASDIVAEAGDDTGPVYLADGRIVFSSTRQRGNQARLLDEGKPQYAGLEEGLDVHASVLHIMNNDGSGIVQISFNQSHDLDPIILPNGKILFSRWDQMEGDKGLNLYQMNADGSDLTLMYGRHSHDSVEGLSDTQFSKASVTPQGQVLLGINSFDDPLFGTNYVSININEYIDNTTPIAELAGQSGPAQQSVLFDNINFTQDLSPQGYINALYPLWDGSGRIIFSWSQCRLFQPLSEEQAENPPPDEERTIAPCSEENLADESFEQAPPAYGLWMYDPAADGGANDADGSQEGQAQETQLPLNIPQLDSVVSEVVALESRPFPANPETTIDIDNPSLIDEAYGVLHIQSVYDVDGVDTSEFGLANMSDPTQVSAQQRPARFLRVVKSVSIPDEDVLEFDNSAFGRSRNQLMREVVGYTPIQPDGSVEVAIPANVPFAISVVNAQGKRISSRHNNWLQLMPGEQKTCIGCHTQDSAAPHGRIDAQPPSVNAGAPSTGLPFPNTNPALFADLGETMAQTVTRVLGLPRLSADIEYEDIWTNPDLQSPSQSFTYAYADLQTPLPISQACAQTWTAICRSVINFPDHIAPIFEVDRSTRDELNNIIADNTCIACHSPSDSDEMLRVPLAQLDLSATPSTDDPDVLTSYRELMFNDNAQEIVDGALLDRLEPVLDANGDPVFARDEEGELILDAQGNPIPLTQTVNVQSSMSVVGALASNRFFAPFEGGSHQGMLSEAELRLIAEWLDVGGQYYNNPFDAPED
uniref:HzsA-related protein n=1 Tax=Ningiella ruwaisensis TaxID=2364274 RepID=UPI00109FC31B|nr:PD40 domain-containing protein [Ningiella ruwaisensis]